MSSLPQRHIGKTQIKASALGFGCMSLTPGFYGDGGIDPVESEKVLRRALELQQPVVLNTADFYTSLINPPTRQNLQLLGKVLPDYPREAAIIAMKIGPWITPGKQPPFSFDFSPASFRERVDEALKVLRVSYIDVLILRLGAGEDPNTTLEETARGMKALVDEGKVKAIGVSEATAEQMRTIHAVVPISVVELEWSLFARDCQKEIVPLAREYGASFLAYSPLGRGLLTGIDLSKLDDTDFRRNHAPRFAGEALDKNQQLALRVAEFAKKKGCTPGQVALAWVLAQGEDVIPIPGTKRIKYLEENIAALDVQLTQAEIDELAALIPEEEVVGARY